MDIVVLRLSVRHLNLIYFKLYFQIFYYKFGTLFLDDLTSSNEYHKIGLLRPISPLQSPKFTSSPINHHSSTYKVCLIYY